MPWPTDLAGPRPSEEDISDASRRSIGDERLTNQHAGGWYPSTASLPWPVDVLVTQWSSAAWGRRQHRSFFLFVVALEGFVVGSAVLLGIAVQLSLGEWLVVFLLPGLPALLDTSELADGHRQLAASKNGTEARIRELWEYELEQPASLSIADCRGVQNLSFRSRSSGLMVPQWFYWLHRDRNEANMRDAAAQRCARYDEIV